MPFVDIRSLPFKSDLEIGDVVMKIAAALAKTIELPSKEVCATWTFIEPNHYAHGEALASSQGQLSHPPLVDLLAFQGRPPHIVEEMLRVVAFEVSQAAKVPIENVFVNYREATKGRVFSEGDIVK